MMVRTMPVKGLAQLWLSLNEQDEGPLMIPTPNGDWRLFEPIRPISSEMHETIRQATRIAWERRSWTREMFVEAGEQSLERARVDAIARDVAKDEREAAIGD
jgi:hypothetical protein